MARARSAMTFAESGPWSPLRILSGLMMPSPSSCDFVALRYWRVAKDDKSTDGTYTVCLDSIADDDALTMMTPADGSARGRIHAVFEVGKQPHMMRFEELGPRHRLSGRTHLAGPRRRCRCGRQHYAFVLIDNHRAC